MKRLLDDGKTAAEGVADGNERDVLERRQAAGELADRHEGAQLTDELGGRRGHRLQVHGVDLGRPRAGARAQGIDGDHDEAAIGHVLGEAVSPMAGDVHVPVRPAVGATRPTHEDGARRPVLRRGHVNRRRQRVRLVGERQDGGDVDGELDGLSDPAAHGCAPSSGISRDATVGAGLVETGAGRRAGGYLPQSFFHCCW